MRDYGKVHSSFWTSSNIRALSEDGRSLAFYLLTCPHGTIAGVFRLPDGYICDDMQWDKERVNETLSELFQNGFATRCETTKWVWVMKHFEWNPPENPNQKKSAAKMAAQVPNSCSWKADFIGKCGIHLGIETKPLPNPSETVPEPVTVTVTVTEAVTVNKKATAVATPDGVSDSLWADFKKLRTAKKAAITQTAIDGIRREAGIAGISLSDALSMCCERGWAGFKADWAAQQTNGQPLNKQEALEARNRAVAQRWATGGIGVINA